MDYYNQPTLENPLENFMGGDLDALITMIDQNPQFFNSSNCTVPSLNGSEEMTSSSNGSTGMYNHAQPRDYIQLESINKGNEIDSGGTTGPNIPHAYLYDTTELSNCSYVTNDFANRYVYEHRSMSEFKVKTEPETTFYTRSPCFDQSYFSYSSSKEPEDVFVDESEFMCRKGKRGAKHVLLWKFILDQLKMNDESIRWVNKHLGTFRFVDTTDISRKWGLKKRKQDMNFEKLSRGIRHYYKSGFMSREDSTRLVYRFHWRKVPKDWRPPEVQKDFESFRH